MFTRWIFVYLNIYIYIYVYTHTSVLALALAVRVEYGNYGLRYSVGSNRSIDNCLSTFDNRVELDMITIMLIPTLLSISPGAKSTSSRSHVYGLVYIYIYIYIYI